MFVYKINFVSNQLSCPNTIYQYASLNKVKITESEYVVAKYKTKQMSSTNTCCERESESILFFSFFFVS